jgi:hypothetical protein
MADLSSVRPGDKLYIKSGHYDVGRIGIVDRVTPTGRIISGSNTFEKNGRLRGQEGWTRTWAEVATQTHFDKIEQAFLADKVRGTHWPAQPLAVLRQVLAILAQAGEARRAETALAGSVHEHAVGEADAP